MDLSSFFIISLSSLLTWSNASRDDETRLRSTLFPSDFSKYVWPNHFDNGTRAPVNVKLDATLRQILDMNEKEQYINMIIWVTMTWQVDSYSWDPASFGNTSSIEMPPSTIWLPDIQVYNDIRDSAPDLERFTVLVDKSGSVTWTFPTIYKATCEVDVTYYPFDIQACPLKYASWKFNNLLVQVDSINAEGLTQRFAHDNEWELLKVKIIREKADFQEWGFFDFVTFHIVIRRLPMFYVFNLVLPCVFIVLVGYMGFLLPSSSGEKISLFITTLLALTVFLLMVADALPPQSKSVPLISQFFGGTILLLSFSCMGAIAVENIHFRGEVTGDFPDCGGKILACRWIQILFLPGNAVSNMKHTKYSCSNDDQKRQSSGYDSTNVMFNSSKSNSTSSEATLTSTTGPEVQQGNTSHTNKEDYEHVQQAWGLLATVLDRILLLLFLIATGIFVLVLGIIAVQKRSYTYVPAL